MNEKVYRKDGMNGDQDGLRKENTENSAHGRDKFLSLINGIRREDECYLQGARLSELRLNVSTFLGRSIFYIRMFH